MGKITGFLESDRELPQKIEPHERVKNNNEFVLSNEFGKKIHTQASRCMDCGVPFCHTGCPIGNIIPAFNDAVYRDNWQEAWDILSSTNNFPEFTGRICPAPCETSCVLGINQNPITICNIEKNIAEVAYERGFAQPRIPKLRTNKRVAIIGSGPTGLSASEQLNSAGHYVTVFERAEKVGGLLRFGIPEFKLSAEVIDRKIALMEKAGIEFVVNQHIGVDVEVSTILQKYDAVLLAGGSTVPRGLPVKGNELQGIHFAMQFLPQQNRRVNNLPINEEEITAKNKRVVVIGGGDTGSDCVGTCNRQGAKSILQLEINPMPPVNRTDKMPWPQYPIIFRTSTSHEEGCDRLWSVLVKEFIGQKGQLTGIRIVDIQWQPIVEGQKPIFYEISESERVIDCDLVLLAMGFLHPEANGVLDQLNITLQSQGNVDTNDFETNQKGVFSAGDMRTGQSIVVRCIQEGRECARVIDSYLMKEKSNLESKDSSLMMS